MCDFCRAGKLWKGYEIIAWQRDNSYRILHEISHIHYRHSFERWLNQRRDRWSALLNVTCSDGQLRDERLAYRFEQSQLDRLQEMEAHLDRVLNGRSW